VPAPVPPGLSAGDFSARLEALPADAELAAWTHLLALWRVDPSRLTVRDAARCPEQIYPGLSCLRLTGNLAKLRTFGRPVLLRLHHGDHEALAVLLALGPQAARLDFGVPTQTQDPTSTIVDVPLTVLESKWLGEYLAVWKSPAFVTEGIKQGEVGPAAAWLRAQLSLFDQLPAQGPVGPPQFDAALEQRVRALQSKFGLLPDGIVGPETQLALTARDRSGPALAQELH